MFVVHAEATHVFRGVWVCLWQITLMERLIWDRVNQRSRATFGGPEFPDPITQISRFDLGLLYQFSTVQGKATNCRVQNMTGSLPVFFSFPANSSFTGARRVNGVQANWYVRRVLRVCWCSRCCVCGRGCIAMWRRGYAALLGYGAVYVCRRWVALLTLAVPACSWSYWSRSTEYAFCSTAASATTTAAPVQVSQLSGNQWADNYYAFVAGQPPLSDFELPAGLKCVSGN